MITGSGGFIGQEVLKEISGFEIIRFKGDLRNFRDIELNVAPDLTGVINLAARIDGSSDQLREVNVKGTENLIEAIKTTCKGLEFFIQIGSSAEYGFSSSPISESNAENPISDYGKSKLEQTQLVMNAFSDTPVTVSVLRLFNVCGKNMSEKMLPARLRQMFNSSGDEIEISNKDSVRDWIDVRDVATLIVKFLKIRNQNPEIYNIGRGVAVTNLELIYEFEKIIGKTKKIHEISDRVDCSVADISKLKKLFVNWTVKYDLKDMISNLNEN